MKIYAIWGHDVIYGGLHGMEYTDIIETEDDLDALASAELLAWDVVESFSFIQNTLEEEVEEALMELSEEEKEEKEEEIRSEIYREDLEWGAIELDKDLLPTLDLNILDDMYYNDKEGFTKEFALRYI